MNKVTFMKNSATYGGAIYTDDGATIHGITLKNNQAYHGGGLYNEDTVTLAGTVVRFNTVNNCAPALSVTLHRLI